MSAQHGKTSRPWDPERYRHEAQSPAAKLPEGDWVFFLLDTVPQLDGRCFYAPYATETRGAPPFEPAMMVCLVLYASCVGVFSSRQIAWACERTLAFMALVGPERPDVRTISDFRTQPLEAFKEVLVHVVRLAGAAGLVKVGNGSTDGTQIQGNASRHKAMRYGYRPREMERLREAIEAVVTAAYQQDAADAAALGSRRGDEFPAELARREQRLATMAAAMQRGEAQAQAAAEAERQQRVAAERQRTGTQRRGKAPQPGQETPADKAQTHGPPPSGLSYKPRTQGGSTAALRKPGWMGRVRSSWPVTGPLRRTTNSKPGQAHAIPATLDNGSDSEAAAQAWEAGGCDPSMATGRQKHHAPEAEASDGPATAQERMAATVRPPEGKAGYARRKVSVEPVCGQSKEARGFRRFWLRGVAKIRGAWRLVCLTHTLLKLWRYGRAPSAASGRTEGPRGMCQASWEDGVPKSNRSLRSPDEVKDGSHRDPRSTKRFAKS